jgi:DNA repair protein RadC
MTTQIAFTYHTPANTGRRICYLPAEDRPLYRLNRHGIGALSTAELLALVLGTAEAPGLSADLLARFGSLHQLVRANKEQFMKQRGIGEAQAGRLAAILELSQRLQAPPAEERPRIPCPADAARLLTRMRSLEQEELWVILLDTRTRVIKINELYKGSLNSSIVRVAEIFRPAIESAAAAIIIAHNHPSSDPAPSPEDVNVTRQIVQAGKLLDVDCLDHLIMGHTCVSLKERNLGFD